MINFTNIRKTITAAIGAALDLHFVRRRRGRPGATGRRQRPPSRLVQAQA